MITNGVVPQKYWCVSLICSTFRGNSYSMNYDVKSEILRDIVIKVV